MKADEGTVTPMASISDGCTPEPLIFFILYVYAALLSFLIDFPYITTYGCVSLLCNVVNRYN